MVPSWLGITATIIAITCWCHGEQTGKPWRGYVGEVQVFGRRGQDSARACSYRNPSRPDIERFYVWTWITISSGPGHAVEKWRRRDPRRKRSWKLKVGPDRPRAGNPPAFERYRLWNVVPDAAVRRSCGKPRAVTGIIGDGGSSCVRISAADLSVSSPSRRPTSSRPPESRIGCSESPELAQARPDVSDPRRKTWASADRGFLRRHGAEAGIEWMSGT